MDTELIRSAATAPPNSLFPSQARHPHVSALGKAIPDQNKPVMALNVPLASFVDPRATSFVRRSASHTRRRRSNGPNVQKTRSSVTVEQLDPVADDTAGFGSRFSVTPSASSTTHSCNSTTTSGCSTLHDPDSLDVDTVHLAFARPDWRVNIQLIMRLWHARSSEYYRVQVRRREGWRQVVDGRFSFGPASAHAWLGG